MNAPFFALCGLILFGSSLGLGACGPKLDPIEVVPDASDVPTNNDSSGGGNTTTPVGTSNLCGTTSPTISYEAHAKAVVTKSCALSSCHGAGGQTPNMTDYATTKAGISGGGLDEVNNGGMPIGRTLTANEKCILQQWAKGSYAP